MNKKFKVQNTLQQTDFLQNFLPILEKGFTTVIKKYKL